MRPSFLCALLTFLMPVYGFAETPDAARAFFSKPLLLGAHRGGGDAWPENTVYAYQHAAAKWPDILLEGDMRLTSDGAVVILHDAKVDRTTNGTGPVGKKTLAEVKALDAAYRHTLDGGKTFPLRGRGLTIPTLQEVLDATPHHRILLELKDMPGIVDPVVRIFREKHAVNRVILASFSTPIMDELRAKAPEFLTCYDMRDGMALLSALRGGDWTHYKPAAAMLSVTTGLATQFKITPAEIRQMQLKGIRFQIHTLNAKEEIEKALAEKVDSILTDKPELLAEEIAAWQGGGWKK